MQLDIGRTITRIAVAIFTTALFYHLRFNQSCTSESSNDNDANARSAAAVDARSECLDRLPGWTMDGHADTLGEQLVVASDGLTDKSTDHRYQLVYHRYLATRAIRRCLESPEGGPPPFRMLEIGLGCHPGGGMIKGTPGGSTRAWRQLLGGVFDLDLHVMEYDGNCAVKWMENNPGVASQIHVGDSGSTESLDKVVEDSGGEPFDLIIDDASHINSHQITAAQHLIKHIAKGGVYIIEDIHSACKTWPANEGTRLGVQVGGKTGCMETMDGEPTILAKLVEWMKPLAVKKDPFEGVTHIDIGHEIAIISKEY